MPPRAAVDAGPIWGPGTLALRFSLADAPPAEAEDVEKKGQRFAWIQISKSGTWAGHESGPFQLSREHFESAIVELNRRENPLSFDYEHASASCIPTHAPAAGWSNQLAIRGEPGQEELWAYTRLTKRAVAEISDDEYRYISPTWMFNHPDRVLGEEKIILASLHSVALTNVPFLDGMQPVTLKSQMSRLAAIGRFASVALAGAAKEASMGPEDTKPQTPPSDGADDTKRIERMMQVLGLGDRAALDAWADQQEQQAGGTPSEPPPPTATPPEKPKASSASASLSADRSALELALAGSTRDAEELATLRREKAERDVTSVISSGRALEAERETLLALRLSDADLFKRLTDARSVVVPLGRESRVNKAAVANPDVVDAASLNEGERRVAANLKQGGFSPSEINQAIAKLRSGEGA